MLARGFRKPHEAIRGTGKGGVWLVTLDILGATPCGTGEPRGGVAGCTGYERTQKTPVLASMSFRSAAGEGKLAYALYFSDQLTEKAVLGGRGPRFCHRQAHPGVGGIETETSRRGT